MNASEANNASELLGKFRSRTVLLEKAKMLAGFVADGGMLDIGCYKVGSHHFVESVRISEPASKLRGDIVEFLNAMINNLQAEIDAMSITILPTEPSLAQPKEQE